MKLTSEEEKMLAGREGTAIQKAMELLVAVGEAYEAEVMIDITYAHILPTEMMHYPLGQLGAWSRELVKESVEGAEGFKVPTTLNPTFFDRELGKKLGYPQPYFDQVEVAIADGARVYQRLGVIPVYTCSPFLIHPVRKGEHLGAAESAVVLFYNSVFGAMTNREAGPASLAAALTGKTPLYGMHLPENRRGQVLVKLGDDVDPTVFTYADYSALSYYVGSLAVDRIPVFSGLSDSMSITALKYLCTSLSVSAGLPMLHAIGITPEAPTCDVAFGGKKPEYSIELGKKEIEETFRDLSTTTDANVELVLFGCPHASITEIQEIAMQLHSKRVHSNVNLVVGTLEPVQILAQKMGLVDIIEEAGGIVVSGMCTACPFLRRQVPEGFKIGTVATNSAKTAHYLKYAGVQVKFGSMQKCLQAATKGAWETD